MPENTIAPAAEVDDDSPTLEEAIEAASDLALEVQNLNDLVTTVKAGANELREALSVIARNADDMTPAEIATCARGAMKSYSDRLAQWDKAHPLGAGARP